MSLTALEISQFDIIADSKFIAKSKFAIGISIFLAMLSFSIAFIPETRNFGLASGISCCLITWFSVNKIKKSKKLRSIIRTEKYEGTDATIASSLIKISDILDLFNCKISSIDLQESIRLGRFIYSSGIIYDAYQYQLPTPEKNIFTHLIIHQFNKKHTYHFLNNKIEDAFNEKNAINTAQFILELKTLYQETYDNRLDVNEYIALSTNFKSKNITQVSREWQSKNYTVQSSLEINKYSGYRFSCSELSPSDKNIFFELELYDSHSDIPTSKSSDLIPSWDEIIVSISGLQYQMSPSTSNLLTKGRIIELIPEIDNKYDSNAVMVKICIDPKKSLDMVGYIPKDLSKIIYHSLKKGDNLIAFILSYEDDPNIDDSQKLKCKILRTE